MPRAAVGDVELYYETLGAGAPLLLIAGFGANSAIFQPEFVEQLARRFRVVTFDNRGTGRSDKPVGPLASTQMADDVAGLLDALEIEVAHIMGVSLGGYVAQELALRHPEMVDRLVLGCTHCGPPVRIPVYRELLAPVMDPAAASGPREAVRRLWPTQYTPEFIAASRDFLEAQLDRTLAYPTPLATRERQLEAFIPWSSHERLHQTHRSDPCDNGRPRRPCPT